MATRHGMRALFLKGGLGQAGEVIFDLDQLLTYLIGIPYQNFKA